MGGVWLGALYNQLVTVKPVELLRIEKEKEEEEKVMKMSKKTKVVLYVILT